MMMLFASKCEAISQSVFGKYAVGVPCSVRISGRRRHNAWAAYPVIGDDARGRGLQVGRDGACAGEEPDLDEAVGALHRVDAAADGIERGPVTVRGRGLDAAAGVAVGVGVAVVESRSAGHSPAGGHCAVRAGVERHRVGRFVVDTFDPEEGSESVGG